MIPYRLLPAAAGLMLLAACGDKAEPQEGSLQGEVLEGTISDAMLPVERVRSEPPLEDPDAFAEAQEGADEAAGEAAAEDEEGEAADTEEGAAADVVPFDPAAEAD